MLGRRPVYDGMREIREFVDPADCDSVCLSVVNAVARAVDADPSRLEPLAGVVDPDVLERLVADADGGDGGAIVFTMQGCEVEVDSGGDITVTYPDALDAGTDATPASESAPAGETLRTDGRGVGATADPDDECSRYEFTEFTDEIGTVAVLYDTGNPDAWIQSTSPAAIER